MQNFHLPWRNGSHAGPVPGPCRASERPRTRPDQAEGCRQRAQV